MNGRSLSIVNKIICHYIPDTEKSIDVFQEWADKNEDIEIELVPIDEHITEDHFDRTEETLGLTIGGDGAFLEGVKEFTPHNIPIMSVNSGTLGFLAKISIEDFNKAINEVLNGEAKISERQRFYLQESDLKVNGINDVMIQSEVPEDLVDKKVASIDVYVDEEYVGEYIGDGVCVSTPTGSTGVSMSAGGPVHYPSNNNTLQILPLNTHNIGVRPLVVSSDTEINIVPKDKVQVMVDGGRHTTVCEPDKDLSISGAETPAHIVRTSYDKKFFKSLTDKLGWDIRELNHNKNRISDSKNKNNSFIENAKEVGIKSARCAGDKLQKIHGNVENVTYKNDTANMVTEGDYKSQKIIQSSINNAFPEHTILSEEDWNPNGSKDGYYWIIDPLDGTGNFTHGNPNYSISIALVKNKNPLLGVIYQPETNEIYHAIKGKGSYKNNKKITTSNTDSLEKSMMISGYDPDGEFIEAFYEKTQGVRAIGSSALNLCYVASGAADCCWEYDTYPWDVAAGLLILKEAGGDAFCLDGSKYKISLDTNSQNNLISTNGNLQDEVQSHMKENGLQN